MQKLIVKFTPTDMIPTTDMAPHVLITNKDNFEIEQNLLRNIENLLSLII